MHSAGHSGPRHSGRAQETVTSIKTALLGSVWPLLSAQTGGSGGGGQAVDDGKAPVYVGLGGSQRPVDVLSPWECRWKEGQSQG